jgi:hypothetical protein
LRKAFYITIFGGKIPVFWKRGYVFSGKMAIQAFQLPRRRGSAATASSAFYGGCICNTASVSNDTLRPHQRFHCSKNSHLQQKFLLQNFLQTFLIYVYTKHLSDAFEWDYRDTIVVLLEKSILSVVVLLEKSILYNDVWRKISVFIKK